MLHSLFQGTVSLRNVIVLSSTIHISGCDRVCKMEAGTVEGGDSDARWPSISAKILGYFVCSLRNSVMPRSA